MTWILDLLSVLFLLTGVFFQATAALGLFVFDRFLDRIHAVAKNDTLGIGCIIIGICLQIGPVFSSLKLLLIMLLILVFNPVAAHSIAAHFAGDDAEAPDSEVE